jgi:hypothetical protein
VPESAVPAPLSSSLSYIKVGHNEILGYGTTAPIFCKIIKDQLWQYYTASIHYRHRHRHTLWTFTTNYFVAKKNV